MALVTLRSYANPIDAEVAKAQLEASGIPAVLVGEHMAAIYSGAMGEVRVQVDESDLANARGLLRDDVGSDLGEQPLPAEQTRFWSGRRILTLLMLSALLAYNSYRFALCAGYGSGSTAIEQAVQTLGEGESSAADLEQAVATYRTAVQEHTREREPFEWGMNQYGLGTALARLGEQESGTAHLEEAVAAYRSALQEVTRERAPRHWTMTQAGLGYALGILGERETGTAHLKEAVAAYRAALQEYTREREPRDWAAAQYYLGYVLEVLADRESGTTRLEEAVTAYRAALQEYTRESAPLDWAAAQESLGNALRTLGERSASNSAICQAVEVHLQLWQFGGSLSRWHETKVPLLRDLAAVRGECPAADQARDELEQQQ